MHDIWGGYAEVEFTDGSRGSYEVAQQYYRSFDKLRVDSPEKFNCICHSVLGENPTLWDAEEQRILESIGLPFTLASESAFQIKSPKAEVRQFIQLAVRPTIISRIFGVLAGSTPEYDLQSPFKHPVIGEPDQVAPQHRQQVAFEWSGTDLRNCPGKYLITQSSRHVKDAPQPQPGGI